MKDYNFPQNDRKYSESQKTSATDYANRKFSGGKFPDYDCGGSEFCSCKNPCKDVLWYNAYYNYLNFPSDTDLLFLEKEKQHKLRKPIIFY